MRSAAELEVINTFQTIMKAIVAHDASEWAKHVADEFVVYASGRAPIAKSVRITAIERQKESDVPVRVGAVQTMRLAVYGDGAVMTATDVDEGRPPYRAALRLYEARRPMADGDQRAHRREVVQKILPRKGEGI